jgi:hypothetical protein
MQRNFYIDNHNHIDTDDTDDTVNNGPNAGPFKNGQQFNSLENHGQMGT